MLPNWSPAASPGVVEGRFANRPCKPLRPTPIGSRGPTRKGLLGNSCVENKGFMVQETVKHLVSGRVSRISNLRSGPEGAKPWVAAGFNLRIAEPNGPFNPNGVDRRIRSAPSGPDSFLAFGFRRFHLRLLTVSRFAGRTASNQRQAYSSAYAPCPVPRVPSAESRVPSLVSRSPSPEPRTPSLESRVSSPEPRVPSPEHLRHCRCACALA